MSSKVRFQKKSAEVGPRQELDLLREQISRLIEKNPEKAAMILTVWLRQAAAIHSIKKAG